MGRDGVLTVARDDILARAIELDDDQPDDVCPGCGQNIDGWGDYVQHYPPEAFGWTRRRLPWPWARDAREVARTCPWDRDFLSARAFRRELIREAAADVPL